LDFYKKTDLYINGSNAFLLSGELATLLSGRYVEIKMQPLSFKEYISAYPGNGNLSALYMNCLQNNSFPGTLELDRKKDIRTYLEGIYNTVLFKDIVTRRISDLSMLQSLVEFIFDNIGNLCSSTKIVNPFSKPEGIIHVIVNGEVTVFNGIQTGKRGGKVLSRQNEN
jgi:predicted AAA+ superfamily ATPase